MEIMKAITRILVCGTAVIAGIFTGHALDLVPTGKTKTLVAYFSATGNTRAVVTSVDRSLTVPLDKGIYIVSVNSTGLSIGMPRPVWNLYPFPC